MALPQFPPDLWVKIVDQENWGTSGAANFARQLIPVMDIFQWVYSMLGDLIKIIPQQPPEFRRVVYGQVKPVFKDGVTLIPLGTVGYNALTKEVLWEVNDSGGFRTQSIRMPVQSVLPICFQMLTMIPWDFFSEIDSTMDKSGTDSPPSTAAIGKWCYDKVREGMKSAGINLPAIPGMGGANGDNATAFAVTIPKETYRIKSSGGIEYDLVISSDITLMAGENAGPFRITARDIGEDDGIGKFGNSMRPDFDGIRNERYLDVTVSTNVAVREDGTKGQPGYVPPVLGTTIMGKGIELASPARRWFKITNTSKDIATFDLTKYAYNEAGSAYTVDLSQLTPTAPSALYSSTNKPKITKDMTIRAVAYVSGKPSSAVLTAVFTITTTPPTQAGLPSASPGPGAVNPDQKIRLLSDTEDTQIYYTTDGSTPVPVQLPAPLSNPPAGAVYTGTEATLICADQTSGTKIYYTTDGSTPTEASTAYNPASKPTVTAAGTIKAIAVRTGILSSPVTTLAYTIKAPTTTAAIPTATPSAGTIASGQRITLRSETDGAAIYYTTDGTEPTTASNRYSDASKPALTADKTIKAVAVLYGMNNSAVLTAAYTIGTPAAVVLTPAAVPKAGAVFSGQEIELLCGTDGADIRWTTDGTDPIATSNPYRPNDKPTVTAAVTIKVKAWKSGMTDSAVLTLNYTIKQPSVKAAAPFAVPSAGAVVSGQKITLFDTEFGADIYFTTDGSTPSINSTHWTEASAPAITAARTIKAVAIKFGMADSDIITQAYTIKAASTTTLYSAAARPTVSTPFTLKAVAVKSGLQASPVFTGAYRIGVVSNQAITPIIGPRAGAVLAGAEVIFDSGTAEAQIYYTTDGTMPIVPNVKALAPDASYQDYMIADTAGVDPRYRASGAVWMNAFTPQFGTVPSILKGEFYADEAANGYLDSSPGVNYYAGLKGSTEVVIKNTMNSGMQLLPSIGDFLLHNIPVMDLSQRLYELVRECVDAITHHPPPFVKPVYAGGVYVQYRYELTDQSGNPPQTYSSLPSAALLRGKTLEVKAYFFDDKGKSIPSAAQGGMGEATLIKYNFDATEGTITYIEVGDEATWKADDGIQVGQMVVPPPALVSAVQRRIVTLTVSEIVQRGQQHRDAVGTPGMDGYISPQEGKPCIFKAKLEMKTDHYDDKVFTVTNAMFAQGTPVAIQERLHCSAAADIKKKTTLTNEVVVLDGEFKLRCAITGIVWGGDDPPAAANQEVGGFTGSKAIINIVIYNDTDADILIKQKKDFPKTVSFGDGVTFNINISKAPIQFPAVFHKKPKVLSYQAAPFTYNFTNKPVAQAEIAFSATLTPMLFDLCRWMPQKSMEYIGEELNVSSPFNGKPADSINRILAARLRFKKDLGGGRVQSNWNLVYTNKNGDQAPAAKKTPHGSVEVAKLEYDAARRCVVIHNNYDNSIVEMRVNACIWFILQELMLVPITMF